MELSKEFLEALKQYDHALDAIFDPHQDSICVWAVRTQGQKVLENVWQRQYGELYPELERRVLHELKKQDVWKRFGSAKALDDHLAERERQHFAAVKRRQDHERQERFKEDKWLIKAALENARSGRLSARDNPRTFQIPTIVVPNKEAVKPQEGDKEQGA